MVRWYPVEDVENNDEWIVDKNMMIARKVSDPVNKFYFLCNKTDMHDDQSKMKPQTETQKELMKPRMIEVNINGAAKFMTIEQFRTEFADWHVVADGEKEQKIDDTEEDLPHSDR